MPAGCCRRRRITDFADHAGRAEVARPAAADLVPVLLGVGVRAVAVPALFVRLGTAPPLAEPRTAEMENRLIPVIQGLVGVRGVIGEESTSRQV